MKKSYFFKLILLSLTLVSCAQDQSYKEKIKDPELVKKGLQELIEKINNEQELSNQDFKKLKFANKTIKDSSS